MLWRRRYGRDRRLGRRAAGRRAAPASSAHVCPKAIQQWLLFHSQCLRHRARSGSTRSRQRLPHEGPMARYATSAAGRVPPGESGESRGEPSLDIQTGPVRGRESAGYTPHACMFGGTWVARGARPRGEQQLGVCLASPRGAARRHRELGCDWRRCGVVCWSVAVSPERRGLSIAPVRPAASRFTPLPSDVFPQLLLRVAGWSEAWVILMQGGSAVWILDAVALGVWPARVLAPPRGSIGDRVTPACRWSLVQQHFILHRAEGGLGRGICDPNKA